MSKITPYKKANEFSQFEQSSPMLDSSDKSITSKILSIYKKSPLRFFLICGGIVALLIIIIVIIIISASSSDPEVKKEPQPIEANEKKIDEILLEFPKREEMTYDQYLDNLVKYSKKYNLNMKSKVWLAYKWISQNIYYKSGSIDPEKVYKNGYTDCGGYANMFYDSCITFGFKDEDILFIHGTARLVDVCNASYTGANHWWNAIYLDGKWNLVDQERGYRTNSSRYFFMEPEGLIRTHFPLNSTEQFLEQPFTAQGYCDQVSTTNRFYDCKIKKIEPDKGTITTKNKNGTIKYYYKNPTTQMSIRIIDEKSVIRNDYGNITRYDDHYLIHYFFPSIGTYQIWVLATPDPKTESQTRLGTHHIIVS